MYKQIIMIILINFKINLQKIEINNKAIKISIFFIKLLLNYYFLNYYFFFNIIFQIFLFI